MIEIGREDEGKSKENANVLRRRNSKPHVGGREEGREGEMYFSVG